MEQERKKKKKCFFFLFLFPKDRAMRHIQPVLYVLLVAFGRGRRGRYSRRRRRPGTDDRARPRVGKQRGKIRFSRFHRERRGVVLLAGAVSGRGGLGGRRRVTVMAGSG